VAATEATAKEKPAAKRGARAAKPAKTGTPASPDPTTAVAKEKAGGKPAKAPVKRSRKTKTTSGTAAEIEVASVTEDEEKDATTETG